MQSLLEGWDKYEIKYILKDCHRNYRNPAELINYVEFAVAESPGWIGQIRNIVYFKTIIEITGIPRSSADFAVAEAPKRDGRITKHITLL